MTQQRYEPFKIGMREKNLVFDSEAIQLKPYDFHLQQGYGKGKTGIEWDDVMYRSLLQIIDEKRLYKESGGVFSLSFSNGDVESISEIATVLYASGDIQKKVKTLTGFFQTHHTSIQEDFRGYMQGERSTESLQKRMHDAFIDGLTELFMTRQDIFDDVFGYVFQDSKMSSSTRKIILEHLFGNQSRKKDNIDRYDNAIRRFKSSIINTIKLKLVHDEDDMDTDDAPSCISQSIEPFVMPEKSTKLECLVIADAIATALTIDPNLLVTSHKMHPRAHLGFEQFRQTLRSTIENLIQDHLSLGQCIDMILNEIEGKLKSMQIHARQIKLLRELVTGYLHGLRRDGKFKFQKCNRYPNDSGNGIKVVANQLLKEGEEIDGLSGQVVKILEQDRGREYFMNDFSIMLNGRNEEVVFLGPASFLNHDCEPNAQYVAREHKRVVIKALREMQRGEEINVFYRDDYFGDGNKDCLCRFCENNLRGGFSRVHLDK